MKSRELTLFMPLFRIRMKSFSISIFFLFTICTQAADESWAGLMVRGTIPERSWKLYTNIPDADASLYVRALDLKKRGLDRIPAGVSNLKNIEYLDLSENEITLNGSDIEILSNLKKLEILVLSKNRITAIPKQFSALKKITHLFIRSNNLSSIPAELSSLDDLSVIELSDNPLLKIPPCLGNMKSLQVLDASRCKLLNWPGGEFKNIKYLGLGGNDLSIKSLEGFPPGLMEVSLANNKINNFTLAGSPPSLISIQIADNPLKDFDVAGRSNVTISGASPKK